MTPDQRSEDIRRARHRAGVTWKDLAAAIARPDVWTVAALMGQHALSPEEAGTIGTMLGLDEATTADLTMQPYRGSSQPVTDPTIYRFHEALQVYGPAIKELIHEEFGDGIMSAINFKLSVERRPDPAGDRVVVTFDGKFLDYAW